MVVLGTLVVLTLTTNLFCAIPIVALCARGFYVFGWCSALTNKRTKGRVLKNHQGGGCAGCPAAASCAALHGGESQCVKAGEKEE